MHVPDFLFPSLMHIQTSSSLSRSLCAHHSPESREPTDASSDQKRVPLRACVCVWEQMASLLRESRAPLLLLSSSPPAAPAAPAAVDSPCLSTPFTTFFYFSP